MEQMQAQAEHVGTVIVSDTSSVVRPDAPAVPAEGDCGDVYPPTP